MSPSMCWLMAKADRACASARLLLDTGDFDGACTRTYYAMFDAARAALVATNTNVVPGSSKTHSGLITAFGLHLVTECLPVGKCLKLSGHHPAALNCVLDHYRFAA